MTQILPLSVFNEAIADLLTKCKAEGMQGPYIFVAADRSGAVTALRFHEDRAPMEVLAEHWNTPGMMVVPFSIMVLDALGEVVHTALGVERAN